MRKVRRQERATRAALDAGAARLAVTAEDAHLARGGELRASDVARAGPVVIDVDAIAEHRAPGPRE